MSKGIDEDVAFIRALAQILKDSDLAEIQVKREYGEDDELKVRLSRAPKAAAPQAAPYPAAYPAPHHFAPPHQPAASVRQGHDAQEPGAPEAEQPGGQGPDLDNAVTSPMVGTAYLAAEPGSDPFVTVGDEVVEGQTLLIVEAMKTMNQIPSPRAGRVRAVLVENGEPVEFGEPLMIIE